MPVLRLQQQLLGFLLLVNIALAGRFSFSIQEIDVREPRGNFEDDLFLAIASTTASSTNNKTWPLGLYAKNQTIKWNNLTQEINVPANASNLSVAIGVLNQDAGAVDTGFDFLQGIVDVAVKQPIASSLLDTALEFFSSLFNCTGAVVVDNIIYSQETLNSLNQNQTNCTTYNYTYPAPIDCWIIDPNSSYTVTYCLERLDAKSVSASAAVDLLPGFFLSLVSLAVALLYGGYAFSV